MKVIKAVKLVTAVKLVKLVPVVIVMIMVIPGTTVSNNNSESSDDSDRGNKISVVMKLRRSIMRLILNATTVSMMMMMMVKPWNNIDSATINKEPELDESNISDVIKQNIELSSNILICGDKVAPGALATAFEKLLKNDKLRKSFYQNFTI